MNSYSKISSLAICTTIALLGLTREISNWAASHPVEGLTTEEMLDQWLTDQQLRDFHEIEDGEEFVDIDGEQIERFEMPVQGELADDANAAVIAKYKTTAEIIKNFNKNDAELKVELFNSIPISDQDILNHHMHGISRLSVLQICQHMFATYGHVTESDVTIIRANLSTPFDNEDNVLGGRAKQKKIFLQLESIKQKASEQEQINALESAIRTLPKCMKAAELYKNNSKYSERSAAAMAQYIHENQAHQTVPLSFMNAVTAPTPVQIPQRPPRRPIVATIPGGQRGRVCTGQPDYLAQTGNAAFHTWCVYHGWRTHGSGICSKPLTPAERARTHP